MSKGYKYGIVLTVVSFLFGYCGMEAFNRKFIDHRIPNIEKVQQGYISPSHLEIKCTDLDRNNELETIIEVKGISYLLTEIEGKPVISDYKVNAAEIIHNE